MVDPADADLARAIACAGPGCAHEAEAALYRRFAPRVRLYGLRHLRDEQAAADLMQQVMVTSIEQLRGGKVRNPEKLGSFIFGLCRMTVLELRRGRARRERLLELYGRDLAADCIDLPRLAEARLAEARLARCLERLSERERSVLVMTFYDEKPAQEVAKTLGLSAANVRVIRHRGLAHLRRCMMEREAMP